MSIIHRIPGGWGCSGKCIICGMTYGELYKHSDHFYFSGNGEKAEENYLKLGPNQEHCIKFISDEQLAHLAETYKMEQMVSVHRIIDMYPELKSKINSINEVYDKQEEEKE